MGVKCACRNRGRWPAVAGVAATLCVAVTACGGSSSGGDGTTAGVKDKTVTIGLNLPFSGDRAIFGQMASGVKAYVKHVNATGGINGYKLTTEQGDNQYDSARAASVARQQARTAFLSITIGTVALRGIQPIADQLRLPVFAGADGSLFTPPKEYLFGQPPPYASVARADVDFAVDHLKASSFGFVYENDDLGQPAKEAVPAYAKKKGAKVLTSLGIDPTATDFSSYAARLKASGAKVVVSWADPVSMPGLQKAAAAIGYHPTWVTFFDKLSPSYTDLAGKLAQGVYVSSFVLPFSAPGAEGDLYRQTMKANFPKDEFSTFALQGWNFAAIAARAIKDATAGGKQLTRQSFLTAMNALPAGRVGMIGSVTYNKQQHYGATALAMFQFGAEGSIKQVTDFAPLPAA